MSSSVGQDPASAVAVERKPQFAISINDGATKWTSNLMENTLSDVTLNVRPGQLVAVIGSVGCGKVELGRPH